MLYFIVWCLLYTGYERTYRCDKKAMIWVQSSSVTNWRFATTGPGCQSVFQPNVTDAAHRLVFSMVSTARREAWWSVATTIWETATLPLANSAWGGVAIEPALVPEDDRHGRPALRADWMARGVWESGRAAFFDNRIIDADAPSYVQANLPWEATASRAASAKKKKYRLAAEEVRGSFTPLVCSTDGALYCTENMRLTWSALPSA